MHGVLDLLNIGLGTTSAAHQHSPSYHCNSKHALYKQKVVYFALHITTNSLLQTSFLMPLSLASGKTSISTSYSPFLQ